MRIGRVLAILVVLLFAATSAMAAGFRLPEAGAKAMGMGFSFVAQADDPSAIYFNPAGIVQLEGQNVMIGGTYIRENGAKFTGTTPLTLNNLGPPPTFNTESETQKDLDFFVPNAYWTRKHSKNLAYGVGIFAPFGLGQEYENRQTSIFRNQVTKVEIQTIVVNPTIAWRFNDVIAVGVGIDFMYGKARLEQTGVVRLGNPPLDQVNIFQLDLDGDGTAWGFNFGFLVTPSEHWKFGAAYRSQFNLKIEDADVDVSNINGAVIPPGGVPTGTAADTTLNLPPTLALGVAYVRDRLTVEVGLDWTFWSKFQEVFIDIRDNTPFLPDSPREQNWEDVVAVRLGGEYRITDQFAMRLGIYFDESPVPEETMSPLLPDADRFHYTAGAGYKLRNWTFDLSYMYVDKNDRSENNQINLAPPRTGSGFNGEWTGDAHLVAFDVGYNF
jgi:long-chain fatty acid transport protein